MSTQPGADRIEQVAFGFMASKVLFGAIHFGVFTELAKGPLGGQALTERLALHPRSARDFLDALVALGMLERRGELYSNIGCERGQKPATYRISTARDISHQNRQSCR